MIDGEVRALASLRTVAGPPIVLVARNDDRLLLLRPTPPKRATIATR